jgi:hypothetical protein
MNLTGWDTNTVTGSLEAAQYMHQLGDDVHAIALNTSSIKQGIWASNMIGFFQLVDAKRELESNVARQNYQVLDDQVLESFGAVKNVVRETNQVISEVHDLLETLKDLVNEADSYLVAPIEVPNYDPFTKTKDYECANVNTLIDGFNYCITGLDKRDELWERAVNTFKKCDEDNLPLLKVAGEMATDLLKVTQLYRQAVENLKVRLLTYVSYLKISLDVSEAYERQGGLREQCVSLYNSLPEGTQVPFDLDELEDSRITIWENWNKFFEVANCATINPSFITDAEYSDVLTWYRGVEKVAKSNIKLLDKWEEKLKTFQSILVALLGRG